MGLGNGLRESCFPRIGRYLERAAIRRLSAGLCFASWALPRFYKSEAPQPLRR
jgi:hypothetical protein